MPLPTSRPWIWSSAAGYVTYPSLPLHQQFELLRAGRSPPATANVTQDLRPTLHTGSPHTKPWQSAFYTDSARTPSLTSRCCSRTVLKPLKSMMTACACMRQLHPPASGAGPAPLRQRPLR